MFLNPCVIVARVLECFVDLFSQSTGYIYIYLGEGGAMFL